MKYLITTLAFICLCACSTDAPKEELTPLHNVVDTPPIKRMKVDGGYVYLFEDTMAMDSYTESERTAVDALFE